MEVISNAACSEEIQHHAHELC